MMKKFLDKCNILLLCYVVLLTSCGGGQEYVDLGLKSGTLWATCNVGATKPEDYGCYFAWGETETKEIYSEASSIWYDVSYSSLKTKGVIDERENLTAKYDVATAKWGQELENADNCRIYGID